MNKEEFIKKCKDLNIEIDEELYNKFMIYYTTLVEWNNKFNMTAIIKKEDVFLLHFYDSLCLIKAVELKDNLSLCDFGTGAGFPGIVLSIVFNNLKVTLVESNKKKCLFLETIKNKLNLKNIIIINDRVENYSKNNREKFDIVTCRAVTSIPIILELSTSLLKINGLLVPLKSNCSEEIEKYEYLEKELGIKLIDKVIYNLPINNANRTIPIYKKLFLTPLKYPRNYNVMLKEYKNK